MGAVGTGAATGGALTAGAATAAAAAPNKLPSFFAPPAINEPKVAAPVKTVVCNC